MLRRLPVWLDVGSEDSSSTKPAPFFDRMIQLKGSVGIFGRLLLTLHCERTSRGVML